MTAKSDIAKAILVFCSGWQLLSIIIQAITLHSRPGTILLHKLKSSNSKS